MKKANSDSVDKKQSAPAAEKEDGKQHAVRGKQAIEAGQIAQGKDPQAQNVIEQEKKDAENWRNEG